MSSYKGSSYSQWKSGLGSYSSASSTSSLSSSTGVGSSTASKYSSGLGLKSLETTRSPSRESSYSSSLSSDRSITPTNRYSSISSRSKDTSSTGISSYGTGKSSLGTSSSSYTKDKPSSMSSYGLGASSHVSSLTSRFGSTLGSSSSNNTSSTHDSSTGTSGSGGLSSSFRPSGTSGYIRSAAARDRESAYSKGACATTTTSIAEEASTTNSTKRFSGGTSTGVTSNTTGSSTNTTNQNGIGGDANPSNSSTNTTVGGTSTGGNTGTSSSSTTSGGISSGTGSSLSSYKAYTPRTLLSSDMKPITSPTTPSSSLRTTARFGLKSGPSHTHYSVSLPTASTLKAAAMLTDEAKKQLSKTQYQREKEDKKQHKEIEETTSWHSRGTCTILDSQETDAEDEEDDDSDENTGTLKANEISNDEEPSFTPRIFSSRYDGVLKHKSVQTDEEPKSKYAGLTAIPRPPLTMNFSSPFTAVMSRFNAEKTAKATNSESTTGGSNGSILMRRGSLKKTTNSSNDSKTSNNATTIGSSNSSNTDQLSRSPLSLSRQTSPASRRNSISKPSPSSIATTEQVTTTKKLSTTTKGSSPPAANTTTTTLNAGGLVVNLANKELVRKSSLNVGETAKEQQRKQEVDDNDNSEQSSVASNNTRSSSLSTTGIIKRDSTRRPPTDPNNKSSSVTNHLNRSSISRMSSQYNLANNTTNNSSANSSRASSPSHAGTTGNCNSSPAGAPAVLSRIKSTKNVHGNNPFRKLSLSLENSNASDSDSSVSQSVASTSSKGISTSAAATGISKLKKKLGTMTGTTGDSDSNNNNPTTTTVTGGLVDKRNSPLRKSSAAGGTGSGGGGGTTCSSTASSRSTSVERSNASGGGGSVSAAVTIPLRPSNLKKSLSKSDNGSKASISQRLSPGSPSSSDTERKKKGPVTIQITQDNDASKVDNNEESTEAGYFGAGAQQGAAGEDGEPAKQTPFFLRMMGQSSWVRKCQSGEIPWWMASNPDVPGTLGKTPSKSVIKVPTTKDIQEEIAACGGMLSPTQQNVGDEDSSSSELSDIECDDDDGEGESKVVLGERTSPDGREIPSVTLLDDMSESNAKGNSKQLFIGTHRNIDDILGFLPANMLAPSPSPAPNTPTPSATNAALQEAMEELVEAQRKLSMVGGNDGEDDDDDDSAESESSSSSELSDDDEEEDGNIHKVASHVKMQIGGEDAESASSDEDDESSSSSYAEVDPINLTIAVPPREPSVPLSSVTQAGYAKGQSLAVEAMDANAGLVPSNKPDKLDDATLQIYRDGDYGTYLDLEASVSEQQEEFEGFHNNRKNSIVLRAQLPVRVHAIIEKLINSDGRELRRALFSLKQIFQEDKDLVHEFVENGGLSCLIKVGSDADQNYQNYILRAIGQVMLYVDGMYGVMRHNETIQWLYSLTASKFRLVQKTALKLLLVFVEYVETNCLLLVQAVSTVDTNRGAQLWSNVMNLLRDHDSNSGDSELLIYAMTLVNKVLNGIPDLDSYYDQIDALEEQGMATIIQNYMGKQCADLDLIQQFQIYEMVLKHEDGEEDNIMMQLDESMRQKLLTRKGYCEVDSGGNNKIRRKSRRRSSNTPPTTPNGSSHPIFPHPVIRRLSSTEDQGKDSMDDGNGNSNMEIGMTPAMRRRRERSDQQKSLLDQKLLNGSSNDLSDSLLQKDSSTSNLIPLGRSFSGKKDSFGNLSMPSALEQQNNLKNSNGTSNNNGCGSPNANITIARPWMLPIYTKTNGTAASSTNIANGGVGEIESAESTEAKREHSVKDLTQKLANQSLLTSPVDENKSLLRSGELSGVVSKAKEGLAKSKSRADLKPPTGENGNGSKGSQVETKKSDNDFHWDFLVMNLHRSLEICDLDFTDLKNSDDEDIMAPNPAVLNSCHNPPPLPPSGSGYIPPPPPGVRFGAPPPPSVNGFGNSMFGVSLKGRQQSPTANAESDTGTLRKTKKTVKLFWKEVREDPITAAKVEKVGSLWTELPPVVVDTQRLEHLFESRAKDMISKKQSDTNKTKEITVLDPKRSNAINIGMTKLPPPRTIKAAIMKMDSTIINREGIEKLLSMLPTEEERAKITEAQFANPETPLGSAEQFLLTLSSISELPARLMLWAFKLDYENLEKEVAEPLMDLKQGIEALEKNKTFRQILTTLLSIGNFLNGADAKGFQIDYLAKVPEVKDTVHKHSLLHHLCHMVLENHPESSDLYSEIGPVTRASRVDFDEVATNLTKMEMDCKASWDHLKVIAKHDGPTNMKLKMSEFLADCAERIIVLGIIHRRVMNRFHKFLLWLGVPAHQVPTTKPHMLFKIISEFALEYRTTRERVIQQLQKKASHRERNKTRGKMITEQIMYKSKEDKADAELREVLSKSCTENGDGSMTWSRRLKPPQPNTNGPSSPASHFGSNRAATLGSGSPLVDGDDEILESLVKTATRASDSRTAPRERKRNSTRYSDRKSLRRTLRHGLSEDERKMLAAFMANGHSFC